MYGVRGTLSIMCTLNIATPSIHDSYEALIFRTRGITLTKNAAYKARANSPCKHAAVLSINHRFGVSTQSR